MIFMIDVALSLCVFIAKFLDTYQKLYYPASEQTVIQAESKKLPDDSVIGDKSNVSNLDTSGQTQFTVDIV